VVLDCLRVSLIGKVENTGELARELAGQGHRLAASGDAETFAHAYEEWGEACVGRLWGVFALVVWDERAGSLLLARDRVGARMLYYQEVPGGFAFGSHLSALREVVDGQWEIEAKAIAAFLALRAVPAPLSIYRSVHKLPAAHVLTVGGGATTCRHYWALEHPRGQDGAARPAELRCCYSA